MKENVRVTANPDSGLVVTKSENNPLWGYARVEQERLVVDESTGILRIKRLSALVPGLVEDLNRLGWKDGQELPGRVIFKEQMLPFNRKNPEASVKIAGETEVACRVKGEVIHRQTFWNPREDAQDSPIQHDNVEEIKAAYQELQQHEGATNTPDNFKL